MAIHKVSELSNVSETWDQNERERRNDTSSQNAPSANDDLDGLVKEAATEYDRANKEERILDGERATVSDKKKEDDAINFVLLQRIGKGVIEKVKLKQLYKFL